MLTQLLPEIQPEFLSQKLQQFGGNHDREALSLVLDAVADLGADAPRVAVNGTFDLQADDGGDDHLQLQPAAGPSAGGAAGANQDAEEIECLCCFGDYPWSEMTQCEDGHLFCFNCARQTIQTGMGLQKTDIKCPDMSGCGFGFSVAELRRFLDPKVFDGYMRLCQQAEIDGFEYCPFCDYGISFDQNADEEPLFRCQNDPCNTVSCRKCKKKAHGTDSCEDAQKNNAKHTLEEAMTMALLRECPKCGNKFMKEEGCNKMTCPCGQISCYVCKKAIGGYDHFNNQPGGCPLWDDSVKRNKEDVERAMKQVAGQIKEANENLVIDDIIKQH
eukprot:jgi/Hompol1/887/HPOL_002591-RA